MQSNIVLLDSNAMAGCMICPRVYAQELHRILTNYILFFILDLNFGTTNVGEAYNNDFSGWPDKRKCSVQFLIILCLENE